MKNFRSDLVAAGRVLAAEGLVTAFGHVSARLEGGRFAITPPKPLGTLGGGEEFSSVSLDEEELPAGTPKEAWIHWSIYHARPDIQAICRAQPQTSMALAASGAPVRALHGHGAFIDREVPVYDDSRLIRGRAAADELARTLGDSGGLIMRGNGAVTVGESVGNAVARMWALEASAEINHRAGAAPRALSPQEFDYWTSVAEELLPRIWSYLKATHLR